MDSFTPELQPDPGNDKNLFLSSPSTTNLLPRETSSVLNLLATLEKNILR